ncbi:MAG: ATP-binding protein [Deltaproteobacteria bacterium]|nr:ATP-binding protein [Deltaproteobacteria bacterium]
MRQPQKRNKLPIGIQTFAEIRDENYFYVDKTGIIGDLVENGKYYFFSRPRRFGKSLLVSTIQALFEGREELFTGLAIHDQWDWPTRYPVIKISFAGVARNREEMKEDIENILEENQRRLGVTCPRPKDIGGCFKHLIMETMVRYGQKVVILVDEYDKLIVDNLDHLEVAKEGREILKDLYTTIKDSDEYIKFAFLTGVSKFSKVSIFSGLNNLQDISLDPRYATLCGYTHNDLETVFAEGLQGADMEEVRRWYNGYNFLGEPVYNPFDILLFIDNGLKFDNYWFTTGTPTFLIKLIERYNYFIPQLDNLKVSKSMIDSYDIENIQLEPLLFQTGYLTIAKALRAGAITQYRLRFPNIETRYSFNDCLLDALTRQTSERAVLQSEIYRALEVADIDGLSLTIKRLFASIPYHNHTKNPIGGYEGYYASVIYAYLASLGLDIIPEDVTSKGRIDLMVKLGQNIYLIEFKVDGGGKALAQLKRKEYKEKYLGTGEIYLIGIDFTSAEKNVSAIEWEKV